MIEVLYFVLALVLCVGICAVSVWIGISPLEQWSRLYVKEKMRNRWGTSLWFRLISDRERNFTRRELILAVVLLLFMLAAVVLDTFFPVSARHSNFFHVP